MESTVRQRTRAVAFHPASHTTECQDCAESDSSSTPSFEQVEPTYLHFPDMLSTRVLIDVPAWLPLVSLVLLRLFVSSFTC